MLHALAFVELTLLCKSIVIIIESASFIARERATPALGVLHALVFIDLALLCKRPEAIVETARDITQQ